MRVTLDEAVMNAILETLGIHAPRRREAAKRGLEVKSVTLFPCVTLGMICNTRGFSKILWRPEGFELHDHA